MAKKYIAYYTLQEVTDPAGRKSRQVPVYSGPLFRFLLAGKELTVAKRVFSLLTILGAVGVAASLMTNAPCARKWYVMFPLALSLLPLFLQGESCFLFWRAKEPLKREQRDKIEKRTVVTAAFSAFLSAFSLAGHIVFMLYYQESMSDAVYLLGAADLLICSLLLIRQREKLKTEEVPYPR